MSKKNEAKTENDLLKVRLDYTKDILDKRYALYSWIDTKVNLSLAINTALLGFSYVILSSEEYENHIFTNFMIITAILFIGVSLFLCIKLTNPVMKTPIWKSEKMKDLIQKQPRTSIGIGQFTPDEYHYLMNNMRIEDMIKYNVDQILKMNSNVNKSSKKLKPIVFLSTMALIILVIAMLFENFNIIITNN